ncbi:MAG: hypothetical protein ACOYZ6_14465 [Chloroflexota bacterium]
MNPTTRYELPPEGISLIGYVVRRMHKTAWLTPIQDLLAQGMSADALARIAMYAVAASTSFGPAYYQPRFNAVGERISEPDPATGATVWAELKSSSPTYKISYAATLPNGDLFSGDEDITGTTVGLRGLGMPAPSKFHFRSNAYEATLTGILTSELALSFFRGTRIRAYGFLNFNDNAGNTGKLTLDRENRIALQVNGQPMDVKPT